MICTLPMLFGKRTISTVCGPQGIRCDLIRGTSAHVAGGPCSTFSGLRVLKSLLVSQNKDKSDFAFGATLSIHQTTPFKLTLDSSAYKTFEYVFKI